jgi:hypothetical protein
MADGAGFDGMQALQKALDYMPENLRRNVLRAWARKWSQRVFIAAQIAAPKGKTRNLVVGLRRRDAKPARLKSIGSLARSVVIGGKPAYHFHWISLGTKPRWTTGGGDLRGKGIKAVARRARLRLTHKPAYRGVMPPNPFMVRAAQPLMSQAEADMKTLVGRALQRLLRRQGRL